MALLADLGHFRNRALPQRKLCAYRKLIQPYAVEEDVLRKIAGTELIVRELFLQPVHALLTEQRDLAVPVSGMSVTDYAPVRLQLDRSDRVLLLALMLADTYGKYDCAVFFHNICLRSHLHTLQVGLL